MSGLACPHCGLVDQVQSVRAVYDAQTSTHTGQNRGFSSGMAYAPGVGLIPTFGNSRTYTSVDVSTILARYLAPPQVPRLAPMRGGCAVAVLFVFTLVFAVMALAVGNAPLSDTKASVQAALAAFPLMVAGVLLIVLIVVLRDRRRTRSRAHAAFTAYSAEYPALLDVWAAALVCHRCHLSYLPADVGRRIDVVPVESFQTMVVEVGRRRLHGE